MKLDTLEDLLVEQLEDLYATEKKLLSTIPKMADASQSPDLKNAFDENYELTRTQISRLDDVYNKLGLTHREFLRFETSGIVKYGEEVATAAGNSVVKDAALIAAAQRVKHYEMAGYGSARTFAHELGYKDVECLLQKTLDEEGKTDSDFTKIAEGGLFSTGINPSGPK
jgi:ferritin-like metal-binding protein YciE